MICGLLTLNFVVEVDDDNDDDIDDVDDNQEGLMEGLKSWLGFAGSMTGTGSSAIAGRSHFKDEFGDNDDEMMKGVNCQHIYQMSFI